MDKKNHLIWIDLEMTGLNSEIDRILEIATVITDTDLNIVRKGLELAIFQEDKILENMDDWCRDHHGRSGLTDKVKKSAITETEAEKRTIDYIKEYIEKGEAPLCGNSVHQDRSFLAKYMPELNEYLHYRNIDVSSVKELSYRWFSDLAKFEKANSHTALNDIYESIAELRYYRDHIFHARKA
ncbi:MAG: oligoribonuclease [Proteobacteria bacterium]|nr:oligoribonuclease [Pseudomonadota bacterium]